jgi:phage terminase large subunit
MGQYLTNSNTRVFKNWRVEDFDAPADAVHRLGADWGFAVDPTTLVRCHIIGRTLYIDYEAGGIGIENNEIPQLFQAVPGSEKWPCYADSARPETISYLRKQHGLNVLSADKWQGSIEDGIQYIKSFESIVINPRCKKTIEEFGLYSYKQDKQTGEVLPVIVDANNHFIDALRYALVKRIKNKNAAVFI